MSRVLVLAFLMCLLIDVAGMFVILKHAYTKGRFWSLVFGFFIPIYLFFYALVDFEHEHKKAILAVWFGAQALGLWIPQMDSFPAELR